MNGNNNPPGGGRDSTVMIPTPGGARPQSSQTQHRQQNTTGFNNMQQNPQEILTAQKGLNPLVNAASTLLGVVIKLRTTMEHQSPPALHKRLTEEVKTFSQRAKNSSANPDSILPAQYLLCTVIDEIVLNTPWGASSGWSKHSLLSLFHKETFGGEKCFQVLNRLSEAPGRHLDLLELFYLCLSLGFQGKFKLDPRGLDQLEQIRDNLYRTIENHRGEMERDLSPRWHGLYKAKGNLTHFIPLWVIISCVLALLVISYSGFRYWLYASTEPTSEQIELLIPEQQNKLPR